MDKDLYIVKAKEYKVKDGDSLASLAANAGITWQELTRFNWGTDKPNEVNRFLKNRMGCSKRTSDGKNYVFTSKDDPGIIYIPQDAQPQQFAVNNTHTVNTVRPKMYSFVSLQTTDVFGLKVPNTQLVLKSRDGWPDVNIVTNQNGVGKKDKVLSGAYEVFLGNGKPAYFLGNQLAKGANPDMGVTMGQYLPAVIHTDFRTEAITRVIVLKGDEAKTLKKRDKLTKIYRNKKNLASLKPEAPGDGGDKGSADENAVYTSNIFCADNLLLAAGVDKHDKIDLHALISDQLHSYLGDHWAEASDRGYYVIVIDPAAKKIDFYDKNAGHGDSFHIKDDVELNGLFGAYAIVESVNNALFVDLATQGYPIGTKTGSASLDEICPESEKGRLIASINSHGDECQIVYFVPTPGQLLAITRKGGNRLLEEYGSSSATDSTVHKRNIAVCKAVKQAFEGYIKWYVNQVKKCNNEEEIRKLGPPDSLFMFPAPATSNDQQKSDLFDANNSNYEFNAWAAISDRLNAIHGEVPEGAMFFSVKVDLEKIAEKEFGVAKGVAGAEFKMNFFVNDRLEIEPTGLDTEVKTSIELEKDFKDTGKIMKTIEKLDPEGSFMKKVKEVTGEHELKGGIAFEAAYNPKTGEKTYKASPSFGIYSAEFTNRGGAKFMIGLKKLGGIVSEGSSEEGDMSAGVFVNLGDRGKVYFMLGFQGIKQDTLLAYFSKAPGFFERRSAEELLEPELTWSKLHYDEREKLTTLKWTADSWDGKDGTSPECTKKPYSELKAEQRIAAVHLGIGAEEWFGFWKKRAKKMDALFDENREHASEGEGKDEEGESKTGKNGKE